MWWAYSFQTPPNSRTLWPVCSRRGTASQMNIFSLNFSVTWPPPNTAHPHPEISPSRLSPSVRTTHWILGSRAFRKSFFLQWFVSVFTVSHWFWSICCWRCPVQETPDWWCLNPHPIEERPSHHASLQPGSPPENKMSRSSRTEIRVHPQI